MRKLVFFLAVLTSVFFLSCEKDDVLDLTCNVDVDNVSEFGKNDGKITVTVLTGNGSYDITYTTGTKSSGGNIIKNGNTLIIESLAAGNYNVTVTDAASKTYTEKVSISQPDIIIGELKATVEKLNENKIEVNATGGVKPYTYKLIKNSIVLKDFQNDSIFDNLDGGTYKVIVKDNNGNECNTEEINIYDELKATITVNQNEETWVDNCIVINTTGGKVPYKYEIIGVDHTSNHTSVDGVFSTISGIFNVVVTDDLNNKVTFNNVEVYSPFDINVDFVNADNTTSDNGKIKIQNFFNRDDVTIKINDGDWVSYTFDGSRWVTIDNVKYGNYTITAKDGHNRTRTKEIEIKSLYGSLRDGGLVFHIFSDGDSAYVAYPTDNSSMNWNDAMTASNSGGWFLPNVSILEELLKVSMYDNRFNIPINTFFWSNEVVASTNVRVRRINLSMTIGTANAPKTELVLSRKVKKIKL